MRIGVLTGGGDAPGLNAAIRAVVYRAEAYGYEVLGVIDGWSGLLGEGNVKPLRRDDVAYIMPLGGTILGTTRTNPLKKEQHKQELLANLKKFGIDALVAIGGDDTLSIAAALAEMGVPAVGVPKTMDNDIAETDYCIGFDTAVSTVVFALDKLNTTASAHRRVMVVEVMGRDAGWVAVVGGLAGGADFIAIPEQPCTIAQMCEQIASGRQRGKPFNIIVVAEGAKITDLPEEFDLGSTDAFGHIRLDRRSIGDRVAREIESRTGFETRITVLGHLQRGGSPTVFDRLLATRVGVAAVDLIHDRRWGYLPVLKDNAIKAVPLRQAVAHNRTVDMSLYELARVFYT